MKNWKGLFVFLLCAVLIFQIPCISVNAATTINWNEKIAWLREKFPDGKYWNHASFGASYSRPDEVTSTPCSNHEPGAYSDPDDNIFDGGGQCDGYARKIYYDIYGQYWSANLDSRKSTDINDIQKGDYVYMLNWDSAGGELPHAVFVIDRQGDVLTVTECNGTSQDPYVGYDKANCRIYWDTTYTIDASGNKLIDNKNGGYTTNFQYCVHKPVDVTISNMGGETPDEPSGTATQVTFVTPGSTGNYNITETNAVVDTDITTNVRTTSGITVGIKVGTTADNVGNLKNYSEPLSDAGYSQLNTNGYFQVWFDFNNELNLTLEPGTTYYYQFYTLINGKAYETGCKSLTTKGESGITATQVTYVMPGTTGNYSITETNAVVDANITTNVRTTSGITVGIKVGTTAENVGTLKNHSEALSVAGYNQLNASGYFQAWFDFNSELNLILEPETTYYYQFYTIINGKVYESTCKSFTTLQLANQIPVGYTEVIEATKDDKLYVAGWAYDPDVGKDKSLTVQVYVGTKESDTVFVGEGTTTVQREDGYWGYDFKVQIPESIDGGKYNVYVYAKDVNREGAKKLLETVAGLSREVEMYPILYVDFFDSCVTILEGESISLPFRYGTRDPNVNDRMTWSIDDSSVIVFRNGSFETSGHDNTMTALKPGVATLTLKIGSKSATCRIIVEKKEEASGHKHILSYVSALEATCENEGHLAHYKCDSCGSLYIDEDGLIDVVWEDIVIEEKGHSWDAGIVLKEPTEQEAGNILFTCGVCGNEKTEDIAFSGSTLPDEDEPEDNEDEKEIIYDSNSEIIMQKPVEGVKEEPIYNKSADEIAIEKYRKEAIWIDEYYEDLSEKYEIINNTEIGGTVDVEFGKYNSLSQIVMQTLLARNDIEYKLYLLYEGKEYMIIIPKGYEVKLTEEWYGPLKLMSMFEYHHISE